MKILKSRGNPKEFLSRMASCSGKVLLLDYDGTLAPFSIHRDRAYPYPGVPRLLNRLIGLPGCRTIIISGRAVKDLLPLLNLDRLPEIWGCHGWERVTAAGNYIVPELDAMVKSILEESYTWLTEKGFSGRCEKKIAGLTVHWRGLAPAEKENVGTAVRDHWESIAGGSGWKIRDFNGGIELNPAGMDKGLAVRAILEETGDKAAVAYLGDDQTDEDAFRALRGKGLSILVGEEPRSTAADLWLKPPDEMLEFLQGWLDGCEAQNE
ncbi:MAG: trehalose-phosphatase [Candidatus Krumholzibacteriota bacterium]|nr:trehalose-phosphatase [Candidatus Krumholzibacteriota bacterium]